MILTLQAIEPEFEYFLIFLSLNIWHLTGTQSVSCNLHTQTNTEHCNYEYPPQNSKRSGTRSQTT